MSKAKFVTILLAGAFALSACGFGAAEGDPTSSVDDLATAAAQTVAANQSLTPAATATETATPAPSNTPEAEPTNTAAPTNTFAAPSSGGSGSGASTCDVITINPATVDQTIPDGTTFSPGETFTKTWRLKNGGTCTWTTSYQIVFISGNVMGATSPQNLTKSVAPGEEIDISVPMTAPSSVGSFRGNWMLRNASGTNFGVDGVSEFWVDIVVSGGSVTPGSGTATATATGASPTPTATGDTATPTPTATQSALVTGVTIVPDNPNQTGACPATFTFILSGSITTDGPIEVTYYWDLNGTPSEKFKLNFTLGGTLPVDNYNWITPSINSSQTGTVSLVIESPNSEDATANISVTCQ